MTDLTRVLDWGLRPFGIRSSRLVYRRRIAPDCLLGCVQIHLQQANQLILPLLPILDSDEAGDQPQAAVPEAPSASEHMDIKHMTQDKAPVPTRIPDAGAAPSFIQQEEDVELAQKLKEAHDLLAARYDSSKGQGGNWWGSDLLEKEKNEERNRRAWAKLGKEPPLPQASKPGGKADTLDSPVPNPQNMKGLANRTITRPLPTYSSSSATSAPPATGKSGSSNKPPAQPAAAGGLPATEANRPAVADIVASSKPPAGRPSASAKQSAAAQPAEPACAAPSPASSGRRSMVVEVASDAGMPDSTDLKAGPAEAEGANRQAGTSQHSLFTIMEDDKQADSEVAYPSEQDATSASDYQQDEVGDDVAAAAKTLAEQERAWEAEIEASRRDFFETERIQRVQRAERAELARRQQAEADAVANANALLR